MASSSGTPVQGVTYPGQSIVDNMTNFANIRTGDTEPSAATRQAQTWARRNGYSALASRGR